MGKQDLVYGLNTEPTGRKVEKIEDVEVKVTNASPFDVKEEEHEDNSNEEETNEIDTITSPVKISVEKKKVNKKVDEKVKHKNFGELKWDIWDHFEESTKSCNYCDYAYKGKLENPTGSLRSHVLVHHTDKLSEEDRIIADQYRERRRLREQEYKTRPAPSLCLCTICGKAFKNRDNLGTHVRAVHRKVFTVFCPYDGCGKGFKSENYLYRDHLNSHTDNIPHTCRLDLYIPLSELLYHILSLQVLWKGVQAFEYTENA